VLVTPGRGFKFATPVCGNGHDPSSAGQLVEIVTVLSAFTFKLIVPKPPLEFPSCTQVFLALMVTAAVLG